MNFEAIYKMLIKSAEGYCTNVNVIMECATKIYIEQMEIDAHKSEMAEKSECDYSTLKMELEVYKNAVDWLADRCAVLDKLANPTYESNCFNAKQWKAVALQKGGSNNG